MGFSCLSFLGRDTVRSPAWFIGRDTVRSPYFSRVLIFRNMQGLRSPEIYLGFFRRPVALPRVPSQRERAATAPRPSNSSVAAERLSSEYAVTGRGARPLGAGSGLERAER